MFGYFQDYLVPQNKHIDHIDNLMINSSFKQPKKKQQLFFWNFLIGFWPKKPPFLGTLIPGPVQLGVWWRTCWRQWIICTATGCCSADTFVAVRTFVFFSHPNLPSAVRKRKKNMGQPFFSNVFGLENSSFDVFVGRIRVLVRTWI